MESTRTSLKRFDKRIEDEMDNEDYFRKVEHDSNVRKGGDGGCGR